MFSVDLLEISLMRFSETIIDNLKFLLDKLKGLMIQQIKLLKRKNLKEEAE